jgi:hypothetical protein
VEATVIDFIQKQIEISERLFDLMQKDHKERMNGIAVWAEMSTGLMNKLNQRNEEIVRLRHCVRVLEEQLQKSNFGGTNESASKKSEGMDSTKVEN